MNWITNYVRPKIRALVEKPGDQADTLWEKCGSCGSMIFHRELADNARVCTSCGHHMRLGAKARLDLIFDEGSLELYPLDDTLVDPLKFRDQKRYSDRLKDAQSKTGEKDALLVASGTVDSHPLVVACFDFAFMGGSMGVAVGDGFLKAAEIAVEKQVPFLAIPASGGARMQEGILSLMQMTRTTVAVQRVREAGLPYLVLLTDPTTGGVTASFAMLGDITLAEPGAVIGFAGQRVIEETIREKLPEGFQRSEYLLEHGMVDIVVQRHALKATLAQTLSLLTVEHYTPTLIALPRPEESESGAGEAQAAEAEVVTLEAEEVVDGEAQDAKDQDPKTQDAKASDGKAKATKSKSAKAKAGEDKNA
ncbi:MAG: acetyl-CoA carboxylase, carboxyltransferase subunit beta [Rhodospirillales bacterium]